MKTPFEIYFSYNYIASLFRTFPCVHTSLVIHYYFCLYKGFHFPFIVSVWLWLDSFIICDFAKGELCFVFETRES